MPSKPVTVTACSATEFSFPSPFHEDRPAALTVVHLTGDAGGAPIHGAGELYPGSAADGGSNAGTPSGEAWPGLTDAMEAVRAARIGGRAAASSSLRELLATLDESQIPAPARAGVEMALLDLAAHAAHVPLARFLGGRPRRLRVTSRVVSAAAEPAQLRQVRPHQGSGVLLMDVLNVDDALDALSLLGPNAAGGPLWLDLSGILAPAEARKLVEAIGDRITAGELPARIILHDPVAGTHRAELAEIQAVADAAVRPAPKHPGILVVPTVTSAEQAASLALEGVRTLAVDPQRLGGLLAARDLAAQVSRNGQGTRIVLAASPVASGIGVHATAALAAAIPAVDHLFCPVETLTAHPVQAGDPPKLRRGRLRARRRAGLGAAFDLAPAVGAMVRHADVPSSAPSAESAVPGANRFDVPPMVGLALVSHMVERAALTYGFDTVRESERMVLLSHPDMTPQLAFSGSVSTWIATSAINVALNKDATAKLLAAADIPIPAGRAFTRTETEDAVTYAESVGYPLVVKPRNGRHGYGVTTDLRSADDVREAIRALRDAPYGQGAFIVERFVTGEDYRLLVVGDRVESVILKRPASVTGDGRSTVLDLVIAKNLARLENPHARSRLIKLGSDAMFWLRRQDLAVESVPAAGRHVRLSSAANGMLGADTIEVLDETHPSLLDLAVRAAHAVPGLDHAGVDLLADHTKGLDEQDAVVLEVNGSPGTLLNNFPLYGKARDVHDALLRRSCDLAGFVAADPRDRVEVDLEVQGKLGGFGYDTWLTGAAREQDLSFSIDDSSAGFVRARVAGPVEQVATIGSRAFIGPYRAEIDRVLMTHARPTPE